MCGIAGAVWDESGTPLEPEVLRRMTDALRHRGPDDRGERIVPLGQTPGGQLVPGIALGFRRLAIIDVAAGQQPLSNEDGSVWVVFNGEIYNFRDLRRRLEGSGHRLRTHSDTEVLVHLYEDEGVDFLRHLRGMFALALWDGRRGELVLARDRLGKKPLVYRQEPGRLLFASELKALLEVPGVPREIDPAALDEYLTYQYVPHPNTIFRGIRKLPPASYAIYRHGEVTLGRYWSPDLTQEIERPDEDYAAALREELTTAVRLRLQSEVPLGAFLSGGVDSSIVVALMKQAADQPVRTFNIGFPDPAYDESRFAQEVAAHLGTEHQTLRVTPSAVEVLPQLAQAYDEPFADSSAVPTWYLSRMTREHVTVALTGDGGDELFAGYERYRAAAWGGSFDRWPEALRRVAASGLWQRLPGGGRSRSLLRRIKRLTAPLALPPVRRYLEWIAVFGENRRAALYTDDFLTQLPDSDPSDFLATAFQRAKGRDPLTAASLADLTTYLPCDLLTKVDIASMAHGLECRAPFLDHHVVELAAAMPLRLKYRRGRGKRILGRVFGDLLPPAVFRRRKMGFGVPLGNWFRGELRETAEKQLLDPESPLVRYFRPAAIRQLWEEHQSHRDDHSHRLWSLLFFAAWHRQWLG